VALQPDPYFALPILYGAPAYSRPPCPAVMVERPLDADDLPLETHQTEEERRLADALLASRGLASVGVRIGHELPGGGHPGYQAPGNGQHDRSPELLQRRLSLRELTDRIRTRS
jgi:hypothetical protein